MQPTNTTGTIPKAYLTILFFDERFNFISAADGGAASLQITGTTGAGGSSLTLANIKAPKNGYAYAYISNRSNADVYFDNFKVQVAAGNLIEENHYYAYGLKIAAISSVKLGDEAEGGLKNNNLYNDKELIDDADLNWYDYGFRNYDPQIGRFIEQDPISGMIPSYSLYHYGFDDPINNIDKAGLIGIPCPGTSGLTIFVEKAGEFIGNAIKSISHVESIVSMSVHVASTTVNVINAINVSDQINTSIASQQVGGKPNNQPQLNASSPNKEIPIFWDEELFPDIEDVDKDYYDHFALPEQKLDIGGDYVFLVFHYLDNSLLGDKNRSASETTYKNSDHYTKNPNGKMLNRHEVPYASTIEGGAKAYSRLASATQNQTHGSALNAFYNHYNLKYRDMFLVPLLRNKKQPQPQPAPAIKKVPHPDITPLLIPIIEEGIEGAVATFPEWGWILLF